MGFLGVLEDKHLRHVPATVVLAEEEHQRTEATAGLKHGTGKDANIIVSDGDILDMKSSTVTNALIQGRSISLDNKQKQLYERYKFKYGIK